MGASATKSFRYGSSEDFLSKGKKNVGGLIPTPTSPYKCFFPLLELRSYLFNNDSVSRCPSASI